MPKSNFISIGNTNIKVSNIKEFGVSKSQEVKAIKTPVFELNMEYIDKKWKAGNNVFKKMFLPNKYVETGKFVAVPKSEFSIWRNNDNTIRAYELPYKVVQTTEKKIKEFSQGTTIYKSDVTFIYWNYLYITTYQNDNYTFFEYKIDIDATLSELKKLVNN